jgi:antirestriction protein ArdC
MRIYTSSRIYSTARNTYPTTYTLYSPILDIPIVEVKKGEDPFADPWAAESKTKKDNVKKNLKNQRRNEGYADRAMGKKKEYGSLL